MPESYNPKSTRNPEGSYLMDGDIPCSPLVPTPLDRGKASAAFATIMSGSG